MYCKLKLTMPHPFEAMQSLRAVRYNTILYFWKAKIIKVVFTDWPFTFATAQVPCSNRADDVGSLARTRLGARCRSSWKDSGGEKFHDRILSQSFHSFFSSELQLTLSASWTCVNRTAWVIHLPLSHWVSSTTAFLPLDLLNSNIDTQASTRKIWRRTSPSALLFTVMIMEGQIFSMNWTAEQLGVLSDPSTSFVACYRMRRFDPLLCLSPESSRDTNQIRGTEIPDKEDMGVPKMLSTHSSILYLQYFPSSTSMTRSWARAAWEPHSDSNGMGTSRLAIRVLC